jgi:glyoxylase-like metal-dependent hydrolase (beta-lactamase superfamily II)
MNPTQPAIPVADHIYQIPLPLPFALRIVNCYLLRADDGWDIVDTGLHTPEGESGWRSALSSLGIRPGDLRHIVITHHHPDHYGMAGWLLDWNREPVPVYTSAREQTMIDQAWWQSGGQGEPFANLMRRAGVDGPMLTAMLQVGEETRSKTLPHAKHFHTLCTGDVLELGRRKLRVYNGPGHSVAQVLLYDAGDRLMFSADQVLLKITPNVGIWPGSDEDPLASFLMSLHELSALNIRLALPGHKALIHNWAGRIKELQQHHQERLSHMAAAADRGATALQVAQAVFRFSHFTAHEMRFAVAETLAHLEHLRLRGQLAREEGQPWRYYRP